MAVSIQAFRLHGRVELDAKGAHKDLKTLETDAKSLSKFVDGSARSFSGLKEAAEKQAKSSRQNLALAYADGRKNIGGLITEARRATKEFERLEKAEQKAARAARGGFSAMLGGGARGGFNIGEALKMLPGLGMLAGAFSSIADTMKGGVEIGFDHNRLIEENRIVFTRLLGTQKTAVEYMKELEKLETHGIALPDALMGARRLKALGFEAERIPQILKTIGDASRGTGADVDSVTRALVQMRAKGKLSAEEINQQLAEQGINAWRYVADEVARVDKAFAKLDPEAQISRAQKMAEQGLISGKGGVEAILRGMNREYGGIGEEFANTTASGLELKARGALSRAIGKATEGAFEGYKGLLRTGTAVLGSDTVRGLADGINENLTTAIQMGARMGQAVVDGARSKEGVDSHSPSRKFMEIGRESAEGFGIGFSEGMREQRDLVAAEMGKFQSRGGRPVNRQVASHDATVEEMAAKYGIDPNLIRAMMQQESGGKRGAVSHKGASGLMQLMPATARRFGVKDIFDPRQNIEGAAKYIRFLTDKFKGELDLILAGYNAGEGAVMKYGNRIPPYRETQNYVRSIKGIYGRLSDGESAPSPKPFTADLTGGESFGVVSPHLQANLQKLIREREDYIAEVVRKRTLYNQSLNWTQDQLKGGKGSPLERADMKRLAHGSEAAIRALDAQAAEFLKELDARIEAARLKVSTRPASLASGFTDEMARHVEDRGFGRRITDEMAAKVVEKIQAITTNTGPLSTAIGPLAATVEERQLEMLPGDLRLFRDAVKGTHGPIKGLIASVGRMDKVMGAFGQVSGMLPNQQVGKKRGFFSKLLGFAAPFLSFIPGVGGVLSTLAGIGSSAVGGDWGGALAGAAGAFSTGGAFRRTGGSPSGPTVDPSTNGTPPPLPRLDGKKALGGPVKRGRTYLVGEHRAEVFTPDEDGWIHPDASRYGGSARRSGSGGIGGMLARLMQQLDGHFARFEPVTSEHVLMAGARRSPGTITDAFMRHGAQDPRVIEWMQRRVQPV